MIRLRVISTFLLVGCNPVVGAVSMDGGQSGEDLTLGPDLATPPEAPDVIIDGGPSPYPLDDVLRLNNVQAKGTHNSYHVQPPKPVDPSHFYTQAPLDVQLETQGVRQLELDLHYRQGAGFQVFHLPLIDPETTCLQLVDCLKLVRVWSDAHPWHLPITIWFEMKEDADIIDRELLPLAGRYDELEHVVLSVWPRRRILTPDEVRGAHADLPSAIRSAGWPTLGKLRGRVIFSMLDRAKHRAAYLQDAPNLAGRLLFVASDTDTDPSAAYFKIDDAAGGAEEVSRLVKEGFIITSNVDAAGNAASVNSASLAASLAAGIQYGSSDFPAAVMGYDYWFNLADGKPARCNPVFPFLKCSAEDIEKLH